MRKKYEIKTVAKLLKVLHNIESNEIELLWEQTSSLLDFYKNKLNFQNEDFFYRYIVKKLERCVRHTEKGIRNDFPYMENFKKLKQLTQKTAKQYLSISNQNKLEQVINKSKESLDIASANSDFVTVPVEFDSQSKYQHYAAFLFRGHGKKEYKLESSIFRGHIYREQAYIKEMLRNETDSFAGLSFFEKLAKIQHYRCPTRLLDVTSNPLIALYFACSEKSDKDDNANVFVFVQPSTNLFLSDDLAVKVLSRLAILSYEETESLYTYIRSIIESPDITFAKVNGTYENEQLEKIYQDLRREDNSVERDFDPFMFLEPLFVGCSNVVSRIKAQAGSFILPPLLPGLSEHLMDDLLQHMSLCISIPEESKKDILKELDRLCINEYTVYCDLESLSKTLKTKSFL